MAKEKNTNLAENVSTRVVFSGDFNGTFDLSGALGVELKGSPYDSNYPCEVSALFRKVMYRKKMSVETWFTFNCVFEGQKKIFKPHRVYIDLAHPEKSQKLPMLAKNIKNLQFSFSLFSVKLSN